MRLKDSYHIYAIITIIFWSLAYVLTRLMMQSFTAFSLGFLRYFVASCTLIFVVIITKMKSPLKSDFPWFIASGAIGFFFYIIVFNKGAKSVTSSTGSVVIATVPVITALLARFIYREALHFLQWVAIVIEFIGVIILTMMDGKFSINTGLFWLFLAVLALSSYNLFQRKLTRTYTALQSCSFSIFFGTIMLGIFLPTSIREIARATNIQIFYIIILGVCSSAIAYVAWSKAFAKAAKTSQVSNYMFVTPFLTSIFGYLFLKEIPDLATIIGGSVILFGLFLFNFGWKIFSNTG
jgi:drug/metabolite transporter (DMT)-like permease